MTDISARRPATAPGFYGKDSEKPLGRAHLFRAFERSDIERKLA
jgi:hypothetical protein